MKNGRSVFLVTGATGFLGSALAARLLEQGHTVRCVVRGATEDDRRARVLSALNERFTERGRLEVVPGDLEKERLGLPQKEFLALGHEVARVIHCGARVNMAMPYEALYETNVRATDDLIKLAEASGAAFCYVGSIAAVAKSVTREPFELTAPVSGGYPQTKWSADRLVSVAHQESRLPTIILRPGRVTADSRTGRYNPDDLLERILRVSVWLGAIPVLDTNIRLSPVDWVGEIMIALSDLDEAYGKAYHLISAETMPWARVLESLRQAGYSLAEVPYATWLSIAVSAGKSNVDVARLAHALGKDRLVFDERIARPVNALRKLAGKFPDLPPAEELLSNTLTAWQKSGELPVPG